MTNKYGDLLNSIFKLTRELNDKATEEIFVNQVCAILADRANSTAKLESIELFLKTYLGKVTTDDK